MFCISFVVVTVKARLIGFDRHLEEAAMDLGANEWTTFRKVTLPLIAPAILAALPALLRDLGRRLRRDVLQRGLGGHVPALRLGRSAHRRAAAGQRDRHGDLRHRGLGGARERARRRCAARSALEPAVRRAAAPVLVARGRARAGGQPGAGAALAGDATADVAIVGGGYTGLWTALALREREPELRVALLEAEICGARAERPQRRLRPRLLGVARVDPPGARRGAGARARTRGRADRPGDPRLGGGARRGRLAARGRDAEVSAAPAQDAAVEHAVGGRRAGRARRTRPSR